MDDPVEQRLLERLAKRALGEKDPYNPFEQLPTVAEQHEAAVQYREIVQARAQRLAMVGSAEKSKADATAEVERLRIEALKVEGQLALEQERLRQEQERLQLQKAEVVLRAMEMAAKNPKAAGLLQLAEGLAQEVVASRRLTVKPE